MPVALPAKQANSPVRFNGNHSRSATSPDHSDIAMREYRYARNIKIDGNAAHETGVVSQLDRLMQTFAGWAVITEAYYLSQRTMRIRPYVPTPESGQCNATATPTDGAAATLRGTTVLDRNDRLPAPGQPRVTGTGTGSDTIVRYSPTTFQPGSVCSTGPGATADEILLHEMIHGVRHMAGRAVREQVVGNPGMTNYEEFVAIVVSNIYRSERGLTQLRRDHAGFNVLNDATTDPAVFHTTYRTYFGHFWVEQQRLFDNLRRARCTFNPVALH